MAELVARGNGRSKLMLGLALWSAFWITVAVLLQLWVGPGWP